MARVLVVEDTADTRLLLAKLLHKSGHVTDAAANGVEALSAVAKALPDVILLDVMMPVMDGIEFLERLRRDPDPGRAALPVILFTGVSDGPHIDRAAQLGVRKIFRKAQFTLEELLKFVGQCAQGDPKNYC